MGSDVDVRQFGQVAKGMSFLLMIFMNTNAAFPGSTAWSLGLPMSLFPGSGKSRAWSTNEEFAWVHLFKEPTAWHNRQMSIYLESILLEHEIES